MPRDKTIVSADGLCIEEGCPEPVKAKGLCSKHHQRLLRTGSTKLKSELNIKRTNQRNCRAAGCADVSVRLGLCQAHLVEFQLDHIKVSYY